uniref:RNase H type-1 domain-containing protein n=1 Tax=Cannabis sativa TaxID=3483 RepID=A0A803PEE7_CANSA
MKVLSWNCRGLGSPATKKALRALVLREDPDVLFLMETKLNNRRMNPIWRSLGFGGASCVEASGSAGGLCLCWKAGVDVLIRSAESGVISGVFSNVLNGPDWTGLFIYGPPVRSDRAVFWEARIMEILSLDHPWVLVGDLNIISGQVDKFGGRAVEAEEGHHLSELLNVTGGVELGCTGNFFTWSNGRRLPSLVKERLDRAICDPGWMILYPKAGVKSLAIKESDHAPVLLDLLFDRERFKTPFRYLDVWSRDESCKVIIKEAWDIVVHGIKSFQLVSKLDNTRKSLSKWNRTHFGMCKEKLKALNRLLIEVQQHLPSDANLKLEADILLEMEEVETRQSEIWKQKSRELWYKDGDRNSRFFHAATVIRRKRNFIDTVSPDGLGWISGRNEVGNYFRERFISVLSSSSPPPPHLQTMIQPMISDEINLELIRIPSATEIREVVWAMHPLKAPGPDGMPGKFYKDHWEIVGRDVTAAVLRNQAFHEHVRPSFFITFNRIKSLVAELNSVFTSPQDSSIDQSSQHARLEVLQGEFVVFADAACKDLRSVAGIIVTKANSEVVEAFSAQLQAVLPLEAEAWALLHAVHRCLSQGWHNVTFAVDCQLLVWGIKARKTPNWRVAGVFARLLDALDCQYLKLIGV